MVDTVRAVAALYLFAHLLQPLIISSYFALEQSEDEEWGIGILLFMYVVFLLCILTSNSADTVSVPNVPVFYVLKIIFALHFIISVTYSYFFSKEGAFSPEHLRRMLAHRKTFLYGIVGNVFLFGWWGRGMWEIALWVCMMTMILFSACIASKQIKLFINNVKQVQGAQSRNKRSKKLKIVKQCIMRASIAVISLVTFVSYALVRAYLLLTI